MKGVHIHTFLKGVCMHTSFKKDYIFIPLDWSSLLPLSKKRNLYQLYHDIKKIMK